MSKKIISENKEQRYSADIRFNVWANNDKEALEQVNLIVQGLDSEFDNRAKIIQFGNQPQGTLDFKPLDYRSMNSNVHESDKNKKTNVMDKEIIKKTLTEEFVSGEKVTKKAQKVSKEENSDYYKDVEKKMGDYDKDLKQEDDDKIDAPKENYEGSEKEYHDEMEIRNGQEMLRYDREPSDSFKERALKSIEGDSTMGNKTYTGKENGNTESVWGASSDTFGKDLTKTIKASAKKRNDATPTINQFGDDIEASSGKAKVVTRKVATEGMKRIKFKVPFNGVENAINLIPEAFKVDGKSFELTDGNEKYKVTWKGSLSEGNALVTEAGDKNLVKEDVNKIKYLMGYKSENTLGSLDGNARVNENKSLAAGFAEGSGFVKEEQIDEEVIDEEVNAFGQGGSDEDHLEGEEDKNTKDKK